jgi:hypothetical protein
MKFLVTAMENRLYRTQYLLEADSPAEARELLYEVDMEEVTDIFEDTDDTEVVDVQEVVNEQMPEVAGDRTRMFLNVTYDAKVTTACDVAGFFSTALDLADRAAKARLGWPNFVVFREDPPLREWQDMVAALVAVAEKTLGPENPCLQGARALLRKSRRVMDY